MTTEGRIDALAADVMRLQREAAAQADDMARLRARVDILRLETRALAWAVAVLAGGLVAMGVAMGWAG